MGIARREFLGVGLAGAGLGLGGRLVASADGALQPVQAPGGAAAPWTPVTAPEIVREVVAKSHGDLEAVRAVVEPHPELAGSAIDWGFGDWESAIGAASHMGRPDIARYLLSKGARPDVFTFAMLGNLDAVRAMVEAMPGLQRLKGPHGFTLAHHARVGGEASAAVGEYLATLEGADESAVNEPLSDDQAAMILGTYDLMREGQSHAPPAGRVAVGRFEIGRGRFGLEFRPSGSVMRNIFHLGGLEFHPAGAPSVRMRFEPGAGGARQMTMSVAGERFWASGVEG